MTAYVVNGSSGGGLPAGGTAADVLTGDGAWTAATTVLGTASEAVLGGTAGAAIIGDGTGHVGTTSAVVSALLASTTQAGMAAAVGISTGRLSARAASPLAGNTHYGTDLDVLLRCRVAGTWRVVGENSLGVTRGPFALNTLITSAVNTGIINLGPGTTIAIGLYVDSLPGASQPIIAECHTDSPTPSDSGWYLRASVAANNRLSLYLAGINGGTPVNLGVDLVTGPCVVVVSIGTSSVRASVNGGTVVGTAISGTYVPPTTGAQLTIGGNYPPGSVLFFSQGSAAWLAAYGSALGDAAIQAIGAANATYLPGESGADPTHSWAACRTPPGADAQAQLIASTPAVLTIASGLARTVR